MDKYDEGCRDTRAVLMPEIERLKTALANVMAWTCLQDDTIWYDEITTLHDHCEMAIVGGFAESDAHG